MQLSTKRLSRPSQVINLGFMITMAQLAGDRADYELQLSASLPAIPESVFEAGTCCLGVLDPVPEAPDCQARENL